MSVRTRSKLTFGNISVRYQKNARSFTIHVYMNGADGFGEHRSRPGAATRRFRRPTAPKEPPERGRRGHGTVEATDVAGAALPGRHSLTRSGGGQPQPASPSVELPWSAAPASIFDPPEAARAAPRSLPDAPAHRRPERWRTRCPVTGRVVPD